jgi:hypothetical protein
MILSGGGFGASAAPAFGQTPAQTNAFGRSTAGTGLFGANTSAPPGGTGFSFGGGGAIDRQTRHFPEFRRWLTFSLRFVAYLKQQRLLQRLGRVRARAAGFLARRRIDRHRLALVLRLVRVRAPRLLEVWSRDILLFSSIFSTELFARNPAKPGGFGAVAKNPNYPDDAQPDMTNPPVPPTGSANPPYKPTQEKEERSGAITEYQNISCQPEYKGASFEVKPALTRPSISHYRLPNHHRQELRLLDYGQGRKFASAGAPATGFGGGFGAASGTAQPSLFGAAQTSQPAFGQAATSQPAAPGFGSTFGATPNTSGAGGLFGGGAAAGTSGGLGTSTGFGQPAASAPGGTGLFGGAQQQTSSGLFGQAASTAAPTGGLFGASTTPAFGQQQQQQPAGSTPFGQQAPKPFSFGTGKSFLLAAGPATMLIGVFFSFHTRHSDYEPTAAVDRVVWRPANWGRRLWSAAAATAAGAATIRLVWRYQ